MSQTQYKIGNVINTKRFGKGKIINDIEGLCGKNEFLIMFFEPFYCGKLCSFSTYAHQEKTYIEIINKKDFI